MKPFMMKLIFAIIMAAGLTICGSYSQRQSALANSCDSLIPAQNAATAAMTKYESLAGDNHSTIDTRLKLLSNALKIERDALSDGTDCGRLLVMLEAWTSADFVREEHYLNNASTGLSADCRKQADLSSRALLSVAYAAAGSFTTGPDENRDILAQAYQAIVNAANVSHITLPEFQAETSENRGTTNNALFKQQALSDYQSFKATMTSECENKAPRLRALFVFFFTD